MMVCADDSERALQVPRQTLIRENMCGRLFAFLSFLVNLKSRVSGSLGASSSSSIPLVMRRSVMPLVVGSV